MMECITIGLPLILLAFIGLVFYITSLVDRWAERKRERQEVQAFLAKRKQYKHGR